eukprot:scaffold131134_cov30-Tisochrysis_lutea.AAC.1
MKANDLPSLAPFSMGECLLHLMSEPQSQRSGGQMDLACLAGDVDVEMEAFSSVLAGLGLLLRCQVAARAGARVHLGGWVACSQPLRRRIVRHGPIVRRGGVGGRGERRALHDPIGLTIFQRNFTASTHYTQRSPARRQGTNSGRPFVKVHCPHMPRYHKRSRHQGKAVQLAGQYPAEDPPIPKEEQPDRDQ